MTIIKFGGHSGNITRKKSFIKYIFCDHLITTIYNPQSHHCYHPVTTGHITTICDQFLQKRANRKLALFVTTVTSFSTKKDKPQTLLKNIKGDELVCENVEVRLDEPEANPLSSPSFFLPGLFHFSREVIT